jgi:FkbM family methyltransferase
MIKKINNHGCSFDIDSRTKHFNFWEDAFANNWEKGTFDFIKKFLNKDKVFIDIGAWIGPISILASFNSKKCISFEPDPCAYQELNQNIKTNNIDNIFLEQKAVSIHNEIFLGAEILGESVTRDNCESNKYLVECISIKEIFEKYNLKESDISVIKIDIEGHESELLKDEYLINLNVPMHVSFHLGFKTNKKEFLNNISKFIEKRNLKIATFPRDDFFSIGFECFGKVNEFVKPKKICQVVFSSNRKEYLERTFRNKNLINYENLQVHKIFIDDYPFNRNDEEIVRIAKQNGFNEIILHDENLGISKTWQEFFDLIKHRNFDYILHHEDDVELTEEVKISNLIDILESDPSLYQIQLKRNNWYSHETDTDFKKDSDVIINNYRLEKNDTYFWMLFSLYPAWISREPILKETGNNPAEGVLSYYLKTKYNLTGGILKKLNGDILVNHFGEYTKGKRVCKGEPGWEGFKDFIPEKKYCSKTGKLIE